MNPVTLRRADLLAPFQSIRDLFEIPQEITYLNCANMAPQLRSVTEAGLRAVGAKASPWRLSAPEWFSGAENLRSLAAQLLLDDESIALVPGASYGIAIAAANLPISASQKIVLLDQELFSNVYAWRELARNTQAQIVMVRRESALPGRKLSKRQSMTERRLSPSHSVTGRMGRGSTSNV